MHRRKFIHFLSTGSAIVVASPYASALSEISSSSDYNSFIKMTGSRTFRPGTDVLNLHLKKISEFQTKGIILEPAEEWFSHNGTVFTSLRLENLLSEKINTHVLFYRKDKEGNWSYLSTYNSYQLKGICRVAEEASISNPADYIIPAEFPFIKYKNELCICQGQNGAVHIKVSQTEDILEINSTMLDKELREIGRHQTREERFRSLLT